MLGVTIEHLEYTLTHVERWRAQRILTLAEPRCDIVRRFLRKPFDSLHRIEIEVPSTTDEKLYQWMVRDRLDNVVPNSMTQSEIARRYDVDRVALTRTLSRLAEDGLIAKNKGHGWTFLPTFDSLVSLQGSYEFRLTLEPACFLLPTFKPDLSAIERVRLQHLYLISHPDIAQSAARNYLRPTRHFMKCALNSAATPSSFRRSSTRIG
ncbi:MAG: transcriptional regulator [Tardiphaga sp.]|nr:transcriptional regulator [Tardiphaga sp.]